MGAHDTQLTVSIPVSWKSDQPCLIVSDLPGVLEVTSSANSLKVRYHVSEIRAQAIEDALMRAGYALGKGILARLRRNWVEFQENNVLAHAKASSHCCNRPGL